MENKTKLKNGMAVYSYSNSALHSVTMAVVFPVDLNVLQKQENGIYHYIEHLFFRRLGDIPQSQLYYTLECLGTSLRGTTYAEYICFSITILPKYCCQVFDILIKIFEPQQWTMSDLREEKKVVLNQILCENYYDFRKIADRKYYQGTGYVYPVMGYASNARFWTKAKVEGYRKEIFDAGRAGFILTGAFPQEFYWSVIEKLSDLPSLGEFVFTQNYPTRFNQRNSETDCFLYQCNYAIADILLSFDVPENLDMCQVEFLSCMLGEGDGSVLSVSLREKLALTNEIYSTVCHSRNGNRLVIQCTTEQKNIIKCVRAILCEIKSFCTKIPEQSFLMAKPFLTENRAQLYDDSYEMMRFLVARFMYPGYFETLEDCICYYQQITLEELTVAAGELFTENNLFIAIAHDGHVQKKTIKNLIRCL